MRSRQVARELALLGLSQLPSQPERLANLDFEELLLASVRGLRSEVQESLEQAAAELQRSHSALHKADLALGDALDSRTHLEQAIALTEAAINRLGTSVDLPEWLYLTRQTEIRSYALHLLCTWRTQAKAVDERIQASLVGWQLARLPRLTRGILRLATTELLYTDTPNQVVINEAVELAKRYSEETSFRLVNATLRQVLRPAVPPSAIDPDSPAEETLPG